MQQVKVYTSGYCCWYANKALSHTSRDAVRMGTIAK